MADQSYVVTKVGIKKLKERLKYLKEVERPQNVRDIEEARAHGDLSENAEYHAAKEKQGWIVTEMEVIEDKLARARVIDPAKLRESKIVFGATVQLLNLDTDEEVTYQIVGEDEADYKEGRISYKSPLARAMIGKEEGDEVMLEAPGGTKEYEVLGFEYK